MYISIYLSVYLSIYIYQSTYLCMCSGLTPNARSSACSVGDTAPAQGKTKNAKFIMFSPLGKLQGLWVHLPTYI